MNRAILKRYGCILNPLWVLILVFFLYSCSSSPTQPEHPTNREKVGSESEKPGRSAKTGKKQPTSKKSPKKPAGHVKKSGKSNRKPPLHFQKKLNPASPESPPKKGAAVEAPPNGRSQSFAKRQLIEKKNQYLGESYREEFLEGAEHDEGFSEWIHYFDNSGKERQIDKHYVESVAAQTGILRRTVYNNLSGETVREKYYYTQFKTEEQGYSISIFYFGKAGEVIREERLDFHGALLDEVQY